MAALLPLQLATVLHAATTVVVPLPSAPDQEANGHPALLSCSLGEKVYVVHAVRAAAAVQACLCCCC